MQGPAAVTARRGPATPAGHPADFTPPVTIFDDTKEAAEILGDGQFRQQARHRIRAVNAADRDGDPIVIPRGSSGTIV